MSSATAANCCLILLGAAIRFRSCRRFNDSMPTPISSALRFLRAGKNHRPPRGEPSLLDLERAPHASRATARAIRLPLLPGHSAEVCRRPLPIARQALRSLFARTAIPGSCRRCSHCSDAAFILAVSPGLLDKLPDRPSRVAVIRPMCQVTPRDAFNRRFDPRGDRPVRLLFIGRIEAMKGVHELLAAADRLRTSGMAFQLTLIGGGPLYGTLAERFSDPQGDVQITGTIADRAQLLRAYEEADIFILPSHHEGFPRVLYEAMIKSLPIVTTLVGGIPALMKHEENCLAIPVDDAAAIFEAVRRLAGDRPWPSGLPAMRWTPCSTCCRIAQNMSPRLPNGFPLGCALSSPHAFLQ